MQYLAIVSLIWAFSFGLIGKYLPGVDPFYIAALRLGIAGLVFLPFLRLSKVPPGSQLKLIGCGAVQFGIMYVSYMAAFQFIPAQSHLVALFSILTPLYVVLINDLRQCQFHRKYLYAALLAIAGAATIKAKAGSMDSLWIAFGLMQVAGVAFGFGQVYYRDWKRSHPATKDHQVFALLYIGGIAVATVASILCTNWEKTQLSAQQIQVLLYLGLVASGLGFFLWNKGAALCRAGTLAAFNNAVVPLAMACSLFIFGEISEIEGTALIRLLIGSACIVGAVFLAEKTPRQS
ncbi:EamA family transporter [Coraliomargarita sp. SDUM461004]|uniref:EamA family transporter n=1 Tax=Thalassobacterium sedimentorum TaxID=3041258 RepID=A0ABU1AHE9_9BACT|nr:EamA family transporter [Coraliomargarita sp. SDUM461004]MDQ8194029.1 EamA family transporter [Coraliomargarita sp. SDUM461004]